MKVTISVPGKIIITGEHAVVYGKPALAAAVDRRLTVELKTRSDGKKVIPKGKLASKTTKMMHNYLNGQPLIANGYTLSIDSDIPTGSGMGSSAAVAAGIVTAFLCSTSGNSQLDHRLINELAYKAEKFQHGNSSGLDPSTVTFGGFVWYRKEFEFLKSLFKFQFKAAQKLQHFYLINTGKPKESTKEMINRFKPDSLDEFEQVTKQITQAIHDEDENKLVIGIKENEKLLEQSGVVSASTKQLIQDIQKSGGVAKISGAGGYLDKSGMVLVYHKNTKELKEAIKKYNLKIAKANLGAEGVKIENIVV